jgi:hypothetical protein
MPTDRILEMYMFNHVDGRYMFQWVLVAAIPLLKKTLAFWKDRFLSPLSLHYDLDLEYRCLSMSYLLRMGQIR